MSKEFADDCYQEFFILTDEKHFIKREEMLVTGISAFPVMILKPFSLGSLTSRIV